MLEPCPWGPACVFVRAIDVLFLNENVGKALGKLYFGAGIDRRRDTADAKRSRGNITGALARQHQGWRYCIRTDR